MQSKCLFDNHMLLVSIALHDTFTSVFIHKFRSSKAFERKFDRNKPLKPISCKGVCYMYYISVEQQCKNALLNKYWLHTNFDIAIPPSDTFRINTN